MAEDQQTDEEILDQISAKGKCLEGFKREYLELKKQHEMYEASVVAKERELEANNAEISTIRDQISFIHRNIDEIASSQASLKDAIDHMNSRRSTLVEREINNRDEITVFTGFFDELKATLAVGPDWTPEQLEQKQTLEKEKDFATGKFEGVMTNVNGIRQEIDRIYEHIQQLEQDIVDKDKRMEDIARKTREFQSKTKSMSQNKDDREQLVFQLRDSIVKAESDLVDKRRQYAGEDRVLKDLESSLQATKEKMEVYLSEYDLLFRTLQDFTSELDRQKVQNRKVEDEITEKSNQLAEKRKDVEEFTKEGKCFHKRQ